MNESAFEYLRPLIAPLSLRLIRLTGDIRCGGRTLSVLYLGIGRNLGWLSRLLFADAPATRDLASDVRPWQLSRTLRGATGDCDVVLTELPPLWSCLQRAHSDIVIPAWIRQEVVLDIGAQELRLPHETGKKIARRIRRHQYRLELTERAEDIHAFYERFYRPYIQARFRAAAGIVPEAAFLQRARGDTLAKLFSDDGWVAGMLLTVAGTTLKFGWFGAISDPPPPGASAALDALCLQYAADRGIRRVVLGNSRPSLADGVVIYKRQFGARIVATRYPQVTLGIGVRRWSPELIRCLREQSLIGVHRGRLVCHDVDDHGRLPAITTRELDAVT